MRPRWPRRSPPSPPVHDIVTPTAHEALEEDIRARRRRYFRVMGPCVALVLFGFFVPAPQPLRVAALVVAAVLPPIAAMVGNASPLGRRPQR